MYSSRPAAVLALLMIASGAWAVTIPLAARGGKVVSMQVPVGTLTITVSKRDLNIYEGPDALIATLFTADGEPAATLEIADDGNGEKGGGMGDFQTGEMTVEIESPGMHRLSITGSSDMVWGLETNAPLMTVRGDMFFSHGAVGGQVYFMPPAWPFKITASALVVVLRRADDGRRAAHAHDLHRAQQRLVRPVTVLGLQPYPVEARVGDHLQQDRIAGGAGQPEGGLTGSYLRKRRVLDHLHRLESARQSRGWSAVASFLSERRFTCGKTTSCSQERTLAAENTVVQQANPDSERGTSACLWRDGEWQLWWRRCSRWVSVVRRP